MRRRNRIKEYSIDTELELEVEVTGTPIPYRPAVHTLRNGDPGYPAEGGYTEDVQVFLTRKNKDGKIEKLEITDWIDESTLERFGEEIYENSNEDY